MLRQGTQRRLSFKPEGIGSHWRCGVQAAVVAVNLRERMALVGECKGSNDPVNRQIVRQLLDHSIPHTIAALSETGMGWRVIPALFARAGTTANAQALLHQRDRMLIDLPTLYADLGAATNET